MCDKEVDFSSLVGQGRSDNEKAGPVLKEFPALFVKSIDTEKRQITALASTGDLDRDNEIILPTAFKELLPVYMKNAVVITSHQHRLQTGHSSVVGNVVKAWIDTRGLWVVIEFVKGTELGDEYWLLYSQKKQQAFSVGFVPLEWNFEERDGQRVRVYTKVELVELSCVPVGSNREALSRSKQRKLDFVQARREERTLEKIEAELRAAGQLSDEKAEEFAKALLGCNEADLSEAGCDFSKIVGGDNNFDFAGSEVDFAGLVG